jgi:hypothetical protein
LKRYRSFFSARNSVYNEYKRGALRRNIEWALTYQIVNQLISKSCHYCNIPSSLQYITSEGIYTYNGIDRVDNNLGYVEGNVVSCCTICNRAKSVLSVEEFREWILRVHAHWIQRDSIYQLIEKELIV